MHQGPIYICLQLTKPPRKVMYGLIFHIYHNSKNHWGCNTTYQHYFYAGDESIKNTKRLVIRSSMRRECLIEHDLGIPQAWYMLYYKSSFTRQDSPNIYIRQNTRQFQSNPLSCNKSFLNVVHFGYQLLNACCYLNDVLSNRHCHVKMLAQVCIHKRPLTICRLVSFADKGLEPPYSLWHVHVKFQTFQ